MCDRHFKAQNKIVFASGKKIDFIGKFENLPSDFEGIRERYGFAELPMLNKSAGRTAADLFSDETRALASKRYEKDFELFAYQN